MLPLVTAHMWGGYHFWPSGRLKTKVLDDHFWQTALREQQIMAYGHSMNTNWQQWRLAAEDKQNEFQKRLQSFQLISDKASLREALPNPDQLRKWWADVLE